MTCFLRKTNSCFNGFLGLRASRLAVLLLTLTASGQAKGLSSFTIQSFARKSKPIVFSVGPKVFWKKRKAAGGAKTIGWQEGLDTRLERIKRGGIYWGLLFDYTWGSSSGHTASGATSCSNNADVSLEARLGYCAQPFSKDTFQLIPFLSLGYYKALYNFVPPSVPTLEYFYKAPFLSTGIMISRFFRPCWLFGLNFQVQFAFDGKRVSRQSAETFTGPIVVERSTSMGDAPQYIIEMPLTYLISKKEKGYSVQLMPFFSYRHYSTRFSASGTFLDTRFFSYGFSLLGTYRF
jgi:hypothetical protein